MDGTMISISDLRSNISSVIGGLADNGKYITVINKSQPTAVVVDFEHFKWMENKLEDLIDILEIEDAKKALAQGTEKLTDFRTFLKEEFGTDNPNEL